MVLPLQSSALSHPLAARQVVPAAAGAGWVVGQLPAVVPSQESLATQRPAFPASLQMVERVAGVGFVAGQLPKVFPSHL